MTQADAVHATSYAGPASRAAGSPLGVAGPLILAFAALNLNGVLFLTTGREAALSVVVLAVTAWLCVRFMTLAALGPVFYAFIGFMLVFIIASLASSDQLQIDSAQMNSLYGTIPFVAGLYFWLVAQDLQGFDRAMRLLKWLLMLSCVATLFSFELAAYFSYVTLERASGLFENPNEAAVVAVACLALVLMFPARSPLVSLLQGAIALGALVMTFSKAGFVMLLAIAVVYALAARSPFRLAMVVFALAGLILVASLVVQLDLFDLNIEQRRRISDMLSILGGEVSQTALTGRDLVWRVGLERIASTFPWGSGVGTFHHLEYGYHNEIDGSWLGVHNTYLMVLGEAGLVGGLAFAIFLGILVFGALRSAAPWLAAALLVIILGDMFSTHHTLALRFNNTLLATVMALAGSMAFRRRLPPAPPAIQQ
jgi:O-antigen ligase